MEDKVFEFLEKIYVELKDFKQQTEKRFDTMENRFGTMENRFDTMEKRFDTMEEKFGTMESDIKILKKDVQLIGAKIDGNITEKIRGLYDARSLTHDKLDQLQFDVNNLTAKTANNDNRIIEIGRDLKRAK